MVPYQCFQVKVPATLPSSAPAVAKDAPKPAAKQIKPAASVTVSDAPTLSKDAVQNGSLQHEESEFCILYAVLFLYPIIQVGGSCHGILLCTLFMVFTYNLIYS